MSIKGLCATYGLRQTTSATAAADHAPTRLLVSPPKELRPHNADTAHDAAARSSYGSR